MEQKPVLDRDVNRITLFLDRHLVVRRGRKTTFWQAYENYKEFCDTNHFRKKLNSLQFFVYFAREMKLKHFQFIKCNTDSMGQHITAHYNYYYKDVYFTNILKNWAISINSKERDTLLYKFIEACIVKKRGQVTSLQVRDRFFEYYADRLDEVPTEYHNKRAFGAYAHRYMTNIFWQRPVQKSVKHDNGKWYTCSVYNHLQFLEIPKL